MRFYISAHDIVEARRAATILKGKGHTIVSTWHNNITTPRPDRTDTAAWQSEVSSNKQLIRKADVLVLLGTTDPVSGGKFFEAGFADALNIPIYVVGPIENGMIGGAATSIFPTVEQIK